MSYQASKIVVDANNSVFHDGRLVAKANPDQFGQRHLHLVTGFAPFTVGASLGKIGPAFTRSNQACAERIAAMLNA